MHISLKQGGRRHLPLHNAAGSEACKCSINKAACCFTQHLRRSDLVMWDQQGIFKTCSELIRSLTVLGPQAWNLAPDGVSFVKIKKSTKLPLLRTTCWSAPVALPQFFSGWLTWAVQSKASSCTSCYLCPSLFLSVTPQPPEHAPEGSRIASHDWCGQAGLGRHNVNLSSWVERGLRKDLPVIRVDTHITSCC